MRQVTSNSKQLAIDLLKQGYREDGSPLTLSEISEQTGYSLAELHNIRSRMNEHKVIRAHKRRHRI